MGTSQQFHTPVTILANHLPVTPHQAEEIRNTSQTTGRIHTLVALAAQIDVPIEYPNHNSEFSAVGQVDMPTKRSSHDSEASTTASPLRIQGIGHTDQSPESPGPWRSLPEDLLCRGNGNIAAKTQTASLVQLGKSRPQWL